MQAGSNLSVGKAITAEMQVLLNAKGTLGDRYDGIMTAIMLEGFTSIRSVL